MTYKGKFHIIVITILFLFNVSVAKSQLTAPGSSAVIATEYPVFAETDMIYIFCSQTEVEDTAELVAETNLQGTKTFLWEKYNPETASFEMLISESTDAVSHVITDLSDGGYRVTITQGETTVVHRAWVFNNRIS
ncbi:MAG: hypothetical protein PHH93_04670, partial [Prolixibacteraceae bacterium]|nr:hypothetical protein [Prolixibacteraceae bacterium]